MAISFTRNSGIVEKRRTARPPLGIEAAVRERGRSGAHVSVTDFSAYGCRIEGFCQINREAQIWIKLPGLVSQPVRVIWVSGTSMGVEFEAPLHPAVASQYLPQAGSHAARQAGGHVAVHDRLLSRREQIIAGITASDQSPLQRRKKPSGMGMFGRISRTCQRSADHRFEIRYGEGLDHGPREVTVDGLTARIGNVSPSGIKIRLPEPQDWEIGRELPVEFEGCPPITGKLVWRNRSEAGVSLPERTIDLFDASEY